MLSNMDFFFKSSNFYLKKIKNNFYKVKTINTPKMLVISKFAWKKKIKDIIIYFQIKCDRPAVNNETKLKANALKSHEIGRADVKN